jgi:hypothetical protein
MDTIQNASIDPALNEGRDRCRDAAAERAEWRLRMLEELAEIEMRRVRSLARQASAQTASAEQAGAPLQGNDLAHTRIARSLRQTLALHARLDEDQAARDKRREAEAAARLAEHATAAERERRQRKKVQARHIVEQVVAMEATDKFHAEDLLNDLHDWLEDDSKVDQRPIALLIARICKDLPIFFDRDVWAEELAAIAAIDGARAAEAAEAAASDAGSDPSRPAAAPADPPMEPPPPRPAPTGSDPPD